MKFKVNETCIMFLQGDITKQDTEAIVNAANSGLLGGGGVDGAIHSAGGPQILAECKQIRAKQGTCPTGEAVITSGGKLTAKYVIHTVGPIWRGGSNDEARLLRNAYWNSLNLAKEKGIRSIAFPSISTGAYSFPIAEAAQIAVKTVLEYISENRIPEVIRFVLFSDKDLQIYQKTWERHLEII